MSMPLICQGLQNKYLNCFGVNPSSFYRFRRKRKYYLQILNDGFTRMSGTTIFSRLGQVKWMCTLPNCYKTCISSHWSLSGKIKKMIYEFFDMKS